MVLSLKTKFLFRVNQTKRFVGMGISKYKILTFDCYGTLVNWEKAILDSMHLLCTKNKRELSDLELFKLFLDIETSVITENPRILYQDALFMVYQLFAETHGMNYKIEDAKEFASSIGNWELFPDTQKVLDFLSRNHDLVILSNVDNQSIESTIKHINTKFLSIYTAQEIGSYKPNKNNFSYMLKKLGNLGYSKDQILHVSVSLYHDHEPALKLGLDTCWINRANTANGTLAPPPSLNTDIFPTYTYNSLQELLDKYE